MFKNLINNLKKKLEIFFLIILIIITIVSTSYINHKKNIENKTYNNLIDNVYFKKTLTIVDSLDPKIKK